MAADCSLMFRCNSAAIIQAIHDEADRTRDLILAIARREDKKLDAIMAALKVPPIVGIEVIPGTPTQRTGPTGATGPVKT